jgi:DNA-binding XRE family transcriptional regulator
MTKEELRTRRDALNMTQDQLASALGVTRQSVYMWEAGKTSIPALLDLALQHVEWKTIYCSGVEPRALLKDTRDA